VQSTRADLPVYQNCNTLNMYQQRWEKLKEKFMQARPLHSAAASSPSTAPVSADEALKQQQQRMSQAEQLKNEGNTLMQSKNYEAAITA
jgi:hypothetical protein